MGRGLSELQHFILEEARGCIIVTAAYFPRSHYNTGKEIFGADIRRKFFGCDTPATRAAFCRALSRLVARGLLYRGTRQGTWHRYGDPGVPLTTVEGRID